MAWVHVHYRATLLFLMVLSAVLGVLASLRESPWEDELYSLRVAGSLFDSLGGYRYIPAYFTYLRLGLLISDDFVFLRLWSFVPWLVALPLTYRLLGVLGVSRGQGLATLALLATNPFLIHESRSVRYYGFFFLTSVVALSAAVFLVENRGRGLSRCVALALLLLPSATAHAGLGLVGVIVAYVLVTRLRHGGAVPYLSVIIVIVCAAAAAYPIRRWLRGVWAGAIDLPVMPAYPMGPVDFWTLAYQYNKLSGWNYLSWYLPAHLVESISVIVVVGALVALAVTTRLRHRLLLVAVALIPLAFWAASPVFNIVCTRYYLFASLPLCLGVVVMVCQIWSRMRGLLRWCLVAAPILMSLLSTFISLSAVTDAPLDELEEIVKREQIRAMSVIPGWYAEPLRRFFKLRKVGIQVSYFDRESLGTGSEPDWVFHQYPRYVWSDAPVLVELRGYEEAARFTSLKKYYFHDVHKSDRLLRLR